MLDEPSKEPTQPATAQDTVTSKPPIETAANTPASEKPSEVSKLTPEEQMALFEKELKENDWGHQPC